jgi:hypothetical protein
MHGFLALALFLSSVDMLKFDLHACSPPAPDEDDDEEAAPKQKGKTFATGEKLSRLSP